MTSFRGLARQWRNEADNAPFAGPNRPVGALNATQRKMYRRCAYELEQLCDAWEKGVKTFDRGILIVGAGFSLNHLLGIKKEQQVRTDGERPIRDEGGRPPQDTPCSLGRPSPYTLEHDEARIAALDDACGVNEQEVE